MLKLRDTLQQWPAGRFDAALKRELEGLPPGSLPLQQGAVRCGLVDDSGISVTVIGIGQNTTHIEARIGVFFTEIVAGCVCGEEPVPENAYCEIRVSIDKITAEANFEFIGT